MFQMAKKIRQLSAEKSAPFIEAFSTNSSFNCANTLTKLGQFSASQFPILQFTLFRTTKAVLKNTFPLETSS